MQFPGFSKHESGVSIPVSALRSTKSLGIGEFADLPLLGTLSREVGLRFIQILPVNDTGTEASPYSALSALALHPVYLRIEELPEFESFLIPEIEAARRKYEGYTRVPFSEVVSFKEDLLWKLFNKKKEEIRSSNEIIPWVEQNPWVVPYAFYRMEKKHRLGKAWMDWDLPYPGDRACIEKILKGEALFYIWLQKRAEEQFVRAAMELDRIEVFLKGDLPILMGDDSADVWAYPRYFRREFRAGAPPDMFSHTGQNWGFPIYNWESLEADSYRWWKDRLLRADRFYHAYRIDHVLGFFRIWAVPERETSGVLGFFSPSTFFSKEALMGEGLNAGRIRWFSEPHIRGEEVRGIGNEVPASVFSQLFQRIGEEDLYLFSPRIGERFLEANLPPGRSRDKLLELYRNRFFVETPYGYAPAWYRDSARAVEILSPAEKEKLQELVSRYYKTSEVLWESLGKQLLSMMKSTTGMLTCAEDLGVVPDCVPEVMNSLGILGLRIPRWTRKYKEAGQPFVPVEDYLLNTVCAASVHDTSTLRQWWEEETDREGFWRALGYTSPVPSSYSVATAEKVIEGMLKTNSILAMFQLQDLFGLSKKYRVPNPAEERINVPGTVTDRNWSYRIPFLLEDLAGDQTFIEKIRGVLKARQAR